MRVCKFQNTFPASSDLPESRAIAPNMARKAPQTIAGAVELVLWETLIILCNAKRMPSTAHEDSTLDTSAILLFRIFEEISMSSRRYREDTDVSIMLVPRMLNARLFSSENDAWVTARRRRSMLWKV